MIVHYLKMALRSLIRYKVQNIISILGIAVGFVCFAFSMIWIKYELSYDTFHRDSDRLYVVYEKSDHGFTNISYFTYYPVARNIKNNFPDVEYAAAFINGPAVVGRSLQNEDFSMRITVDSAFINMFDIKLLSGSWSFLNNQEEVAVTEEFAERVYGTKNVLGKDLFFWKSPKKISAIVSGWGKHSNFRYDIMLGVDEKFRDDYRYSGFYVCLRLKDGIDVSEFTQKLKNKGFEVPGGGGYTIRNLLLEKLSSSRYTVFYKYDDISLSYIKMFSVVGITVILVSLVNFFSILITRMNIRRREIALRISCGSSTKELILMFVTELVVMMLFSGLIGMSLMELLKSEFVRLADIEDSFYLFSLWYFFVILIMSVVVAVFLIRYTSRKTVSEEIIGNITRKSGLSFQNGSIVIQFIISVTVLFCLAVLFKQLYYLKSTDEVGFERDGKACLYCQPKDIHIIHYLRKLPYVHEIKEMYSLLPQRASTSSTIGEWDGKSEGQKPVTLQVIREGRDFLDFYGIKLLRGNYLTGKKDIKSVLINEAAVRMFGWSEPIGKKIYNYTVVGVIKDFHISLPTQPVKPYMITLDRRNDHGSDYVIRFDEEHLSGLRNSMKDYIEKNGINFCYIKTANEAYEEYLVSEKMLLKLLSFVSMICVVISLFGVYSHVSLSCERRRKEIAIRKINGATAGNIMKMFFKDYLLMLAASCMVAFLTGTIVMKKWLEQYVEQTSMDAWIYFGLFILMAAFILLCVARSIWKAANENPAEVIKSE